MTSMGRLRRFVPALLVVAALGCDDEPETPTIGTPPSLGLAGTWTGLIGTSGSGNALRATWTATQTGNAVTGTITLNKAAVNLDFSGTLSGTLSANQLTLTYTIPRGNVPGIADCSMSGTGSADVTDTALVGTLTITYTNCQSFIIQPSTSEPLAFSK